MTVRAERPARDGHEPRASGSCYAVLVGVFAAYIAGRALGPGVHYLQVFRFVGASAFMGYSLALLQNSIWWKRNWAMTLEVDGRRARVRAAHRRHLRLAVAALMSRVPV